MEVRPADELRPRHHRPDAAAPAGLFDAVVTAEDVSAYKPDPAHFRLFQSTFGASADVWMHVAQSYYHDIVPTHELGITRVWVNRQGEKNDPSLADVVVRGMDELPGAVARLATPAP